MWTYHQQTGELIKPDGTRLVFGFAGQGVGLNSPPHQDVHNIGPLPQGEYSMTGWIEDDSKSVPPGHLGLCVIVLEAAHGSVTFGRAGFRVHGARSLDHSGLAAFLISSEGCICIGDCAARKSVWVSGDRTLRVVA